MYNHWVGARRENEGGEWKWTSDGSAVDMDLLGLAAKVGAGLCLCMYHQVDKEGEPAWGYLPATCKQPYHLVCQASRGIHLSFASCNNILYIHWIFIINFYIESKMQSECNSSN